MPGNLDFRVYASRDDEEAVAVIHEWADESSFAAYLVIRCVRPLGRGAPPIGDRAPGEPPVPRRSSRDGLTLRPALG